MRRYLFAPAVINGLHLTNRLVRSATWEGLGTAAGRPTGKLEVLYRDLARGGVGLIISGFAAVAADGRPLPGTLGVYDGDCSRDLGRLPDAVHAAGGRICLQLGHAGGQTRSSLIGTTPLAPSAVAAAQYHPEVPRVMTPGDIERVSAAFAAAAALGRACGFDAVQVNAAHGYLLNQFLSPHTNRRTDGYGGDLAGRSRLLLETVARVRQAVGTGFPLLVKLNAGDNLPGGLTLEEAVEVGTRLDRNGIDAIEVTSGTPASGERTPLRRPIASPRQEAYNLAATLALRSRVHCPLVVTGGLRSSWTARGIVARGEADFIGLSRPLVCEPALPRRWQRTDGSTLARCTSCNGCFKTALQGQFRCILNPPPGPDDPR